MLAHSVVGKVGLALGEISRLGQERDKGGGHWAEEGRVRGRTFACVIVDWDSAGCDVRVLGGVGDVAEDYSFGKAIADFESRHF